ncbi:MAG: methylmalonyl-CoA mutase [Nocardioidaceae bacterium]|nr:methylmalonyl-CoA mutase [Nocardioidaceae bacterium]
MEHLSLLAGGQEHSRAEWEKVAADVLRRSGRMKPEEPDSLVWRKLTRTTLDGIEIAPLGTPESVADLPTTGAPGQAPYTRGAALSRPDQGWDIRTHVGDPDAGIAATAALDDLENGATSLWLTLGPGGLATADLGSVLEKVYVDLAPVVLDAPSEPVAAAEAFVAVLADRGVPPAAGTSLGGDPVSALVRTSSPGSAAADFVEGTVRRLAELAQQHGTLALTVDGTAVHDLGATDAQELGYTLAVAVHYLRTLTATGTDLASAAALLEFRYAVTDEQFTSIAKLRAARRLWQRVLELSGVADAPGQAQHAVTSRAMTTKHDPWVNLLRGTVAAFAAGVGGASSVTVLPFDAAIGLPDGFSRRIARNTSSLLVHEAHVARVTDPAGGAYAVERLTDDLARSGWARFQDLEADGGVLESLAAEQGGLLERILLQAVEPRQRQVATRRRPITGVSEFPNLEERLPERRPLPEGAPSARRYAAGFDALRDDPTPTPVFLATLGTVAQHTARAGFAANLLAAGGVATVAAGATSGVEDLLGAYDGQPVVCLAGSDPAYAGWGSEAATALREAGARYVIIAGKPGERTVPASLVDDSCATGVDALAFLTRVRQELFA